MHGVNNFISAAEQVPELLSRITRKGRAVNGQKAFYALEISGFLVEVGVHDRH